MKSRDVWMLLGSLVVLVGAGLMTLRWAQQEVQGTVDFPDGLHFICMNPACQNEFTLSRPDVEAYAESHPDSRAMGCTKCGQEQTVRAMKCPHCEKLYVQPEVAEGVRRCPRCKHELRPLAEGI
jgi:hypothetical protein